METEKFYSPLSVSWRTRKADGITQYKSEALRTQVGWVYRISSGVLSPKNQEVWCLRTGKDWCPSSRREKKFTLPSTLVLFGASVNCLVSTHTGEGGSSLLSLLNQMLISSRNTLTVIPRNNVLPAIWVSYAQSSWHIKLTTTYFISKE